uniref:Gellan gum biosynthesis protein n=1 Tax=Sphingomonas elodea ATCC 31461 TaxID=1081640 RepID=A0A076LGR1_SPHEL|nr:gellan gum biosynthesis protein [Sphingomonas elodea ATCC 31461]
MKPGTRGTFVPVNHVRTAAKPSASTLLARVCGSAVLFAGAASAQPAMAQQRSFPPRPTGTERQIDVRATAALEYNDNVVLNDPRIAQGAPRDDVSAAPSLDLNILLPRPTGSVYVSGNIGYRFYRRYSYLNREMISLSGGIDQRLASCVVHGDLGYHRRLSDLSNLSLQDSPESFKNTEEVRPYSTDIGCGGQYGLRPAVAFSRTEVRNSRSERSYADSNTNMVTAQLGLLVPAIGTVSVFGRYADSSYPRRPVPAGSERDGLKSYAAGLQLERSVGQRLDFRGSANYTKADPKLRGTRGFSGFGFDLSAAYKGDPFTVLLSGSRSAEPSQLFFISYEVVTTLTGSVTRQLGDRTSLSLRASKTWRDLSASELFPNAPRVGNNDIGLILASAVYRPSRRLRFSLEGGYERRTSNVQLYQYRAKRINLTTSLSL